MNSLPLSLIPGAGATPAPTSFGELPGADAPGGFADMLAGKASSPGADSAPVDPLGQAAPLDVPGAPASSAASAQLLPVWVPDLGSPPSEPIPDVNGSGAVPTPIGRALDEVALVPPVDDVEKLPSTAPDPLAALPQDVSVADAQPARPTKGAKAAEPDLEVPGHPVDSDEEGGPSGADLASLALGAMATQAVPVAVVPPNSSADRPLPTAATPPNGVADAALWRTPAPLAGSRRVLDESPTPFMGIPAPASAESHAPSAAERQDAGGPGVRPHEWRSPLSAVLLADERAASLTSASKSPSLALTPEAGSAVDESIDGSTQWSARRPQAALPLGLPRISPAVDEGPVSTPRLDFARLRQQITTLDELPALPKLTPRISLSGTGFDTPLRDVSSRAGLSGTASSMGTSVTAAPSSPNGLVEASVVNGLPAGMPSAASEVALQAAQATPVGGVLTTENGATAASLNQAARFMLAGDSSEAFAPTPAAAAAFARAMARASASDSAPVMAIPTALRDERALSLPVTSIASTSMNDATGARTVLESARVAAPPAPVNDQALGQQIVQGIRLQWQGGVGQATIQLHPEHLGSLTVSLKVEGQSVSADIRTETTTAQQWISTHETELRSGLEKHGLTLERFVVKQDEHQQERQFGQQPRRRQQQPRSPRRSNEPLPTFEVAA